jgi:hypothetical protein
MPHPVWFHVCAEGSEVYSGSPEPCGTCGVPGVFDGWALSMWEQVARYRYTYGLNPFGPHRPLADELLVPMRDLCLRCGGRAVLTAGDGTTWRDCPACEGTGGVWNRPFEEVDAAWREVVARWPDAVMRDPPRPRRRNRDREEMP